jgi:hypothetical protein
MNLPTTTGGAQLPSDPAQMQDYYRKMAEAYASTERRAGSSVSVRNGVMSVGDQPIPGNQFAAIILDAVRLNTFYKTGFNPSNIEPPTCYAISRDDASLAPHPDMAKDLSWFQPQADRCGACPHNEFGSARQGEGKACQNRRRLLMLVVGTYAQTAQGWQLQPNLDVESYASAPLIGMTLAPTTLGGWGAWVRDNAAKYGRPPFGVIARLYLYAHPKHGKEAVGFETLAPVPDEWMPTIVPRFEEATKEIMQGYDAPHKNGPGARGQQQGGGFYNVQNGAR